MSLVKDFLSSKKFWAMAAGVILLVVKAAFPEMADLNTTELVGVIMAYLVGQGIADSGKSAAIVRGKF